MNKTDWKDKLQSITYDLEWEDFKIKYSTGDFASIYDLAENFYNSSKLSHEQKEILSRYYYNITKNNSLIRQLKIIRSDCLSKSKKLSNVIPDTLIQKKLEVIRAKQFKEESEFVRQIRQIVESEYQCLGLIEIILKNQPEILRRPQHRIEVFPYSSVEVIGIYRSRWDINSNAVFSEFLRTFKTGDNNYIDFMKLLAVEYLLKNTEFLNDVDILTNIPAEFTRENERSHDLSKEIASAISEEFCIPLFNFFIRRFEGEHSRSLSLDALRTQYELDNIPRKIINEELTILVVDDIVTRGNTLRACGELLRKIGFKKLKAFCLAKTERSY